MAKGYVLYNPKAGNGEDVEDIHVLGVVLDGELQYIDIARVTNYPVFLGGLEQGDYLVIAGGDGTLNRFINDTDGLELPREILYCPTGNGNGFARDLRKVRWDNPFPIGKYLKDLPSVQVNGKTYRFLNGVGCGIDSCCRQAADAPRKHRKKRTNHTAITMKGLLFHYKPTAAKVTVDGVAHTYDKVWMAPVMYGRYCGNGMMPAPEQDRNAQRKTLSVMVLHGSGRLKTLLAVPSVFRGTHTKRRKMVDILVGNEITVEFDRPSALQIDGETIAGVSSYTAKTVGSENRKQRETPAG